jgi:hypothetical protein
MNLWHDDQAEIDGMFSGWFEKQTEAENAE